MAEERNKRSIADFALMITHKTGRNALQYNNYGCWCGIGGGGNVLDGVDGCCKAHDLCYRWIERQGCHQNGHYTESGSNQYCPQQACMCDKRAAECFGRNRYNRNNKGVNRAQRC
ncbi:hypothetical protein KUTeg_005216 [Tegillarca granosa]|uniref:Phospholipase A2 n=1 Tax=Tegillarca granosa TaxID=220873 RepID=A0ABQ9FL23_TEGGR|nr:hypothetical protein KUTeg_005216 [Tegillarca granosa]